MSNVKSLRIDPNREQLQALKDYAVAVGDGWKKRLLLDWMRAGTAVYELRDRYHLLQQVRNSFGPKWLARFDLNDPVIAKILS